MGSDQQEVTVDVSAETLAAADAPQLRELLSQASGNDLRAPSPSGPP